MSIEFIEEVIINQIWSIVPAITSLIGLYLIAAGYSTWKKQLRGKTEYQIAIDYLRATLKLRNSIAYVRNHFITIGEMQASLKEEGFAEIDIEDRNKTNQAVYSVRWKKVLDAMTELESAVLEAEVVWGKEAVEASEDMNLCARKLLVAVNSYLHNETTTYQQISDGILYSGGEPDEFKLQINDAVDTIKVYLKKYL